MDYNMPNELPEQYESRRLDFKAIKARIDLPSYIEKYTVLIPAGKNFKAKCPLPTHADKTASMMIYPDQQTWWCFGCNTGSDLFDFAMKMDETSARDLDRL